MLKNLFLSNRAYVCAIIQDDSELKGTDIFRALLNYDIQNHAVTKIHLIACDNPPEFYLNGIDRSKVVVHNIYQDPNCWLQKNKLDCNKLFKKIIPPTDNSTTIMIDSLNFLIRLNNERYTFMVVNQLKKLFHRVVCLLHVDEITKTDVIRQFIFISHIYLRLYTNKLSLQHVLNESTRKVVEIIYIKQNGKISSLKEIVTVDENFNLHFEVYADEEPKNVSTGSRGNFKNITTFRLGLDMKDNEKKARDELILPFMRRAKISNAGEHVNADSDDPDDDLDI